MIEPPGRCALEFLELHGEPRPGLHGGAEFERRADRVGDVERASLVRRLDPTGRQPGLVEICLGLLEVLIRIDAQPDPLAHRRLAAALEHEAVVARFLDAAQVERVFVLVAHHQPDGIDIERAADAQIFHRQHRMARARDVEGRIGIALRNAHGASPSMEEGLARTGAARSSTVTA